MKSTLSLLSLSLCLAGAAFANTNEQQTTLLDQSSVAVTIYNDNLALIKDQRTLTLNKGFNLLAFRDVSAKIQPETALFRSLSPNIQVHVLEQNFDFDLLTPQKLLEKYIGKTIQLVRTNPATGTQTFETATVLSTNNGITLRSGNKIITNPNAEYVFDNVPENLRDTPTLVTQLTSSSEQKQTVELAYLTRGLSWKADYVAELNSDDTQLDLTGWITLTNQSGAQYNNAKLQLVAGDVNQVRPAKMMQRGMPEIMMMADSAPAVKQENLFEYHLYNITRPTTLADKQTKQVALLSASSVPVNKLFLLQGNDYYYYSQHGELGQQRKIAVFVEFDNNSQSQLGLPLPKGIVRVYKNDSQGKAQFVGEDNIDHTPEDKTLRLKLGDAFDITADKKQLSFTKRSHQKPYHYAHESSYEITLYNAKDKAVTVTVREPIPGDWTILEQSHPHKKVAAQLAQWQVTIPAKSNTRLSYKALVQY